MTRRKYYTDEEYHKWCVNTLDDLRQMALQWDDLSKSNIDLGARTAYKDASITVENFIHRASWIKKKR